MMINEVKHVKYKQSSQVREEISSSSFDTNSLCILLLSVSTTASCNEERYPGVRLNVLFSRFSFLLVCCTFLWV